MLNEILLDNQPIHFKESDLPCLVTYGHGTGGSHLSVTMMADMFLSGSKILFLTAYPMAKDNFLKQVEGHEEKVAYITSEEELDENAQAIIIESGNEELFLKVFSKLSDVGERVIFIKNIEGFTEKFFEVCENLEKVLLSGDIDKSASKQEISKKEYATIIAFTKPDIPLPIDLPKLEKYHGYMKGVDKNGDVSVKM